MQRLPVIVGFGGYNAAGRSSSHHGFRRMIIDSLSASEKDETVAGLAVMMGLVVSKNGRFMTCDDKVLSMSQVSELYWGQVRDGTLVRKLETNGAEPISNVGSAAQLPSGFDVASLYKSRSHPRNLQITICGISDALYSMGIDWGTVVDAINPDEVAVYVGSILGQVDECGVKGVFNAYEQGKRVSAKQLPLSLNTMPADFINAYVLGSVGTTGCVTGACATFLYNLKAGIESIQNGNSRVVIVGSSEAPVIPEVIDGFAAMNALATEKSLKKLDHSDTPDYQKSSRPFGDNCGFVIAEASQFIILMDDALAVELGAQIHGAATGVFVNADGFKKSISAPGAGNYLTLAKAMASAKGIVGEEGLRLRSFVHAHGSSTPANRTTESELLNDLADSFNISSWPVTAAKAYVGHSIGSASGDQMMSVLGSFRYGVIPGIETIKQVADDVRQDSIKILTGHHVYPKGALDVAFINSKGFGGNNATGVVISPDKVEEMLLQRYGLDTYKAYCIKRKSTISESTDYDQRAIMGDFNVIYNVGEGMIDPSDLKIVGESIVIPGFINQLSLSVERQYSDMLHQSA